jgi:cell fate regulator YaaT (PSP1 superfamily)
MNKINVRFPTTGKICFYQSSLDLKPNDEVIVETDSILEAGSVVKDVGSPFPAEEGTGVILRKLTAEDKATRDRLKLAARKFLSEAREKTLRHGLDIKILDAELSFDQKKLTFYFSADGRVDFRSLVSDMAKSFNKLIRLQQVGSRDEAKYFGGIGKCGRELCCSKFLNNLESITLEMAQAQELSTAGSSKLSGSCGKLMCCLSYEVSSYEELKKKMPPIGSLYKSPKVNGKVVGHSLLEGKISVEGSDGKKVEVSL